MVPAGIIESQIARTCPVQTQWKWKTIQHGKDAYLVSFPSFEDVDREIPHKLELKKVWVHVDGVPHTVRHFLGFWAISTLMGKTLDIDLASLRCHGIVFILLAMTNTSILSKEKDDVGHFLSTDVMVKLKGYVFTFRRKPTDFISDLYFPPFIWRRKGNDADDDNTRKEWGDDMDTSKHATLSSNLQSSRSTSTKDVQMTQVQQRGLASIVSPSACRTDPLVLAVTPFKLSPQTPRGIQLLVDLRVNSVLRGCLERSPELMHQGTHSTPTLVTVPAIRWIHIFCQFCLQVLWRLTLATDGELASSLTNSGAHTHAGALHVNTCIDVVLCSFLNISLFKGFTKELYMDVYRHILEYRLTHFASM
ncbi:hypothetical protein ZWY2020_035629 [Hordeum vulgare]|nr:hypothetical protein ZWY2020_035629 [Hordeum vulgare]